MEDSSTVEEEDAELEKEIDSKTSDWNLILVNKDNFIPENYKIETVTIESKYEIDIRAKDALEQMLKDARTNGLDPIICSAYRTNKYQQQLFNKKVKGYLKKGIHKQKLKNKQDYG